MRILVAMSGGVDSSVVAHMLSEQGHELIGVRFQLWTDPLAPAIAEVLPSKCCNTQTVFRAAETAKKLGIPLHIVDLQQEFKEAVVDPFLKGYKEGRSPNPCIGCNRQIKFGKLLEMMKELKCDVLATGHYARTAMELLSDGTKRALLLEAIDQSKDQSYYLYGLSQEQLSKVLFPLGGLKKSEVFKLAEHFGVPYEESTYRESQDLCFFPEKEPAEFLKRYLGDSMKPGPIMRRDGTVVGTHKGLPLYTLGQRRGLGVGGLTIPLEVVEKNMHDNALIVATKGTERVKDIELIDLHFISWKPDPSDVPFECRVRSLSSRLRGTLTYDGKKGRFQFADEQQKPAPGQSLVLYKGEEVVGGGVIA